MEEYQADATTCEQLFHSRRRLPSESFAVYYAVLEKLYWDAFTVAEHSDLSEEAATSVTRHFLRGIPQDISKKLQLDHPTKSGKELAKEAKRMEEILAWTKATEVCAVNTNGTQEQIDSLRGEIRDLKVMLKKGFRAPLKPAMLSWTSLIKYCYHHHQQGGCDPGKCSNTG